MRYSTAKFGQIFGIFGLHFYMNSSKFLELNEGMLHERHQRMTKHYAKLAEINSKS